MEVGVFSEDYGETKQMHTRQTPVQTGLIILKRTDNESCCE